MLRRGFLIAVLSLQAVLLGLPCLAATVVDSAGRSVEISPSPARVLAAGPPASVLLYALAPEKMAGWVRPPSEAEKRFIAEPYRDLPVSGRLTDQGGAPNIDKVLAMKPDLILDVGTVDADYAALAVRVQQQTGIPYVLIDGSFARTPETLRQVGGLLGVPAVAETQAKFAEEVIARLHATVSSIPADRGHGSTTAAAPTGCRPGLPARSTPRCWPRSVRPTSPTPRDRAGSPTSPRSRWSPESGGDPRRGSCLRGQAA